MNIGNILRSTHSNSWGLGPRLGMQANLLCGYGLSLIAKLAISALFTQYHDVHAKLSLKNLPTPIQVTEKLNGDYNVVRPILKRA